MAMKSQTLKNVGKVLFEDNTLAKGGGLSSIVIPKKFTKTGALGALGVMGAVGVGSTGIQTRNKNKLGRISYGDGPARMTGSFTSGAVGTMNKAANGNYAVFSDMASNALKNDSVSGIIEDYGATPELVSALYGMGGK